MSGVIPPKSDSPKTDGFGLWIKGSDLAIALVLLAGAFLAIRIDAVPQLVALAANKGFFTKAPLLLDQMRHGYSYDAVRDHLHALGADGRSFYAHSFIPIYDLALSVFLLTFSILFILYATQRDRYYAIALPGWLRRVLVIPPILQFVFDVCENIALRQLLTDFPTLNIKLVEAASQLTQAKWLAIYFNALIFVALAAFTIYRWCSPARAQAAT